MGRKEQWARQLPVAGLVVVAAVPLLVAHFHASARLPATAPPAEPSARPAPERQQTEDLRRGRLAFMHNCAMCHGYGATGKLGQAPSLSTPQFLSLATDGFIRRTVREGRLGSAMAPRRDVSREDLTAVIAYLRSLPGVEVPPEPVDREYEAAGDPAAGEAKYRLYCSPCHGRYGGGYAERGTAPGIGLPGFLHQVPDDFILQTVARGRLGTAMRSFLGPRGLANLDTQDVADIIVFLRDQDEAGFPDFLPYLGEDVFFQNCVACHQEGARGQAGVAPSLSSPEFLALATDDFIRRTVRRGRRGTAMVPRTGITDWELEGIIEYLRSLPANGKSPLKVDESIRFAGDPRRGEASFTTFCAPCHGPRGEGYIMGGIGPAIGLPGFLEAVPDDYIFKTVKHGRSGTPMRPFSGPQGLADLDDQEIEDIVVFLRSRVVLP